MRSILKRMLIIFSILNCVWLLQPTASAQDDLPYNFLVITDIHLNSTTNHLMDISPTGKDKLNDLDEITFTGLLDKIKDSLQTHAIPTPDFILLLGDVAQHDPEAPLNTANDAHEVFQTVQNDFPSIPLFYIFGNNDSLDTHFGPFYSDTPVGLWHSMYDVARSSGWTDGFLSNGNVCGGGTYPCLITSTEDSRLGHYSAYIKPSLRLIGINSIVFSNEREDLTEADAQLELNWVAGQLLAAHQNHESVLLATHIPLGFKQEDGDTLEWMAGDHASFLQLISQYKEEIIGMLAAHTHMDELKIMRTSPQNNIAAMLNSPALCTYSGNAPAVKTYYYRQNGSAWELSDTRTFYFSQIPSNDLQLQELFSYHGYYNCASSQNITDCLSNVTLSKMNTYYTAGNSNFHPTLQYPDALYINLPTLSSNHSGSSNNIGTIIAIVAGTAAVIGVSVLAAEKLKKEKTETPLP